MIKSVPGSHSEAKSEKLSKVSVKTELSSSISYLKLVQFGVK